MTVCPACGSQSRQGARFCDVCGAPLAAPAMRGEERKVVSVLFVDLVGSTAAADGADPEDVRATLRAYHERVKGEIERYGGTVEKFVGDAVMAVFGAPVAHEDDAERAVRAALAVVDACAELGVEVRGAVNTGEALVALGARAEAGEALVAGDVVNTAARLQGAAPVGGTVVGEATWRAARGKIDLEELEPVVFKGKTEPVRLWRVAGARSRFGVDVDLATSTPFVGRGHELTLLRETFLRAVRESSLQLVTVTGEPGVGKSRLVAELADWVDGLPELVSWRQGRCLPYGEGIAYWALGEIVKAEAGVLESDASEEAAAKLAAVIESAVEESERSWLLLRLAPLVGGEGAEGSRAESFSAWQCFLEALAADRPLVLVLEDVHWADEALVEFVDHLVDWATGVPIVLLCTARPEVYERHPGWGAGKRNSTTISLAPLDGEDTARLLAALLEQAVLPAETQAELLERAGGNPLYAEEFVRMLRDRDLLDGGRLTVKDVPVPDTVQALIAARIDTLPPERKAVLQDAAVLGKVFWAGAVAAMGGRERHEVEDALRELVRKELVRPARRSSVEGETELAFWHVSVRDVTYHQIPREARGRRHEAAGRWLEDVAGEGSPELLAYHFGEALDLARAAGQDERAAVLLELAVAHLLKAAERQIFLDLHGVQPIIVRLLELVPEEHPARPYALLRSSYALYLGGAAFAEAEKVAAQALALFRRHDDLAGAGETLSALGGAAWARGAGDRANAYLDEAVEVLSRVEDWPALATALAQVAFRKLTANRPREALAESDAVLALCREHGITGRAPALALGVRGGARADSGDRGGEDDLREAIRAAIAAGQSATAAFGYVNLADFVWPAGGPERALAINREGVAFATRRGLHGNVAWARAESVWMLYELGRWDELLAVADEILAAIGESQHRQPEIMVSTFRGAVQVWRERLGPAAAEEAFLGAARTMGELQVYVPAIGVCALAAWRCGDGERGAAYAREHEALRGGQKVAFHAVGLPDVVRGALAAGDLELAGRIAAQIAVYPRERIAVATAEALLAEARGDVDALDRHQAVAAEWRDYGFVLEHALALLGAARCGGTEAERDEGEAILLGLGIDSRQNRRSAATR